MTANPLPPLTPSEYAALKASIEEHGVLVPILVDRNGEIVDGFHRLQITRELDLRCPKEMLPISEPEERIAYAIALNAHRRQLTEQQRKDAIEQCRALGLTVRKTAEVVGVSRSTVSRESSVPSGTSGQHRRATPQELRERDEAVLADLASGMKQREVAAKHGLAQSAIAQTKKRAAKRANPEPILHLVDQRGHQGVGLTVKAAHTMLIDLAGTLRGWAAQLEERHEDGSIPALYLVEESQYLFEDIRESIRLLGALNARMTRERGQQRGSHAELG